jgi:hypothetical protein
MQCQEFEHRLNEVLDERSDPAADARLVAHAESCSPCRTLLAGQRSLIAGLRRSAPPPLAPEFARRVVAESGFASTATPRPASTAIRSKALLAASTLLASAAAALLALSIVWYARSREPAVAESMKPSAAPRAKDAKVRAKGVGSSGTLAMTRRDWVEGDWAQGDWLVEAPRFPDHLRDSLDELADSFPESVQRFGEVERLAPGIRPLRLSFAILWDTLFRALPGVSSETSIPEASAPEPSTPRPGGRTSSAFAEFLRLA